jgi:hypothetical protein
MYAVLSGRSCVAIASGASPCSGFRSIYWEELELGACTSYALVSPSLTSFSEISMAQHLSMGHALNLHNLQDPYRQRVGFAQYCCAVYTDTSLRFVLQSSGVIPSIPVSHPLVYPSIRFAKAPSVDEQLLLAPKR